MKIQCQNCKLTGNVEDSKIPPDGLVLDCPKCKSRIVVKKEAKAGWKPGAEVSVCPACQYSTFTDETFGQCPKCGIVVEEYNEKLKEKKARAQEEERLRREEEIIRQQYAKQLPLPGPQASAENPPGMKAVELPVSVTVIGWLAIIVAVLLLIAGGRGLLAFSLLTPPPVDPYSTEQPVTAATLFLKHGLQPVLQIIFSVYLLVAATQLLQLRRWARSALEVACWLGMVGILADQVVELLGWISRGSDQAGSYYTVGVVSAILMLAIWLVPVAVVLRFLRGKVIRKAMSA